MDIVPSAHESVPQNPLVIALCDTNGANAEPVVDHVVLWQHLKPVPTKVQVKSGKVRRVRAPDNVLPGALVCLRPWLGCLGDDLVIDRTNKLAWAFDTTCTCICKGFSCFKYLLIGGSLAIFSVLTIDRRVIIFPFKFTQVPYSACVRSFGPWPTLTWHQHFIIWNKLLSLPYWYRSILKDFL